MRICNSDTHIILAKAQIWEYLRKKYDFCPQISLFTIFKICTCRHFFETIK